MAVNFNLRDYLSSDEYKNNKYYVKLKYFFQFLEDFYPVRMYEEDFFSSLEADEFLLALEYYIEKKNNPAQNTVSDYQMAFISFIKMLHHNYGIRNSTFFDNEKEDAYKKAANSIINGLKKQEHRGCLDENRYEILVAEIDNSIRRYENNTEILSAIENSNKNDSRKIYNEFVSVIAIKLVMIYGLKNKRIRDLKIDAINIEKKTLQIDIFELPLNVEMIGLFERYLIIREQILKTNNVQSHYLFVTIEGDGYDSYGTGYIGSLFSLLKREGLPKISVTEIGYRRIVELVDRGANIAILANLTGHKNEIIKQYENERLTTEDIVYLVKKFDDTKGLLKCPFCGEEKEAVSENWVLREVYVDGNPIKRITCKNCKGGIDGAYRY